MVMRNAVCNWIGKLVLELGLIVLVLLLCLRSVANAQQQQLSTMSRKPFSSENIRYISANGDDSNDGLSWGTAMKTVAAACAALPNGNSSCASGNGTILAGPGYSVSLPVGTTPAISLQIDAAPSNASTAAVAGTITSGPIPWIDIRAYGARAFQNAPATITVTSNGTNRVTTTGVSDFIVGDGIAIPRAGNVTAQSTPSAPTVQNIGAKGSSAISYKCVGVDANWGLTAASNAGGTSTAPAVFGQGATAISTIRRSSNLVTVRMSSPMPFSSGSFHVTVGDVTGGTTNFSGLYFATVTSDTTLTYDQTGANESGVVHAGTSYVLFENAFVLTSVKAAAGSNQLVLTTDVNHDLQQQLAGIHPTKLFLDGINFPGAANSGFANGLFSIATVTANTITVTTPYTSPQTASATASAALATSRVAQMTATVWAEQLVTCPTISGTTVYYAVYADYGSGYAPIGFTTWLHNIFIDYGRAFTQAKFVPPPAMNLPATPPASEQNQIFSAQIKSVSSNTLTLDRSVPLIVTNAIAYHDDGVPLLNAINESCQSSFNAANNNRTFYPVYLPPTPAAQYYFFNAPVDLSATPNSCNRIVIVDGGALFVNGTITASNAPVVWQRPEDIAGVNVESTGGNTKFDVYVFGYASPMMAGSAKNLSWFVRGLLINPLSNGQNGFVNTGPESRFEDVACSSGNTSLLSSICFVNAGPQFTTSFHNFNFGDIPNLATPLSPAPGNSGQVMYWPVPSFLSEAGPSNQAEIILDGQNYGNGRGFEISNLYPATGVPLFMDFVNVQTFQEPWQPFLTLEGSNQIQYLRLEKVQMDSIQMPVLSSVIGGTGGSGAGFLYLYEAGTAGSNYPAVTGDPFSSILETRHSSASSPSQNTNETAIGPNGLQQSGPVSLYCNPNGSSTSALTVYESTNRPAVSIRCPSGTIVVPSLLSTGINDGLISTVVTTGTAANLCTNLLQNTFNQEATAGRAVTYTLCTAVAGKRQCVFNSNNGANPDTGVLTVATSAAGQFIIFIDGTLSASGGNVTSGGAAADSACFLGVDSTHWQMLVSSGTWIKH